MRILLAYAGKHQTAKSCVERLVRELHTGNTVEVVNLAEATPDPREYDLVVLGSAVYFGKLLPSAKSFIKTYTAELCQKPLGLFLVCGLTSEYEYYREKLFPSELRNHAFLSLYFGGSLSTKGLSFFERLAVKSMRSAIFEEEMEEGEYTLTLPSILPENIDRMATYIRRQIEDMID